GSGLDSGCYRRITGLWCHCVPDEFREPGFREGVEMSACDRKAGQDKFTSVSVRRRMPDLGRSRRTKPRAHLPRSCRWAFSAVVVFGAVWAMVGVADNQARAGVQTPEFMVAPDRGIVGNFGGFGAQLNQHLYANI